jgi:hypothetical protein
MKQIIQKTVLSIHLLLVAFNGYSQSNSIDEKINGYCDHILVTIPGVHYDSLIDVLKSNIPRSMLSRGNTKDFILPSETFPYVELWNSSTYLYIGSQIALGSKEENAVSKAKSYYGHEGTLSGDFLLTVGSETSSGHPYGGNFFVDYGTMDISNPKDSIEVSKLKTICTLAPKTKPYIIEDYHFFGLDLEVNKESFKAIDINKTTIHTKFVDSTPEAIASGGIGHVSLEFELNKALYHERKEITFGDEIKLVYDGKSLILILLNT